MTRCKNIRVRIERVQVRISNAHSRTEHKRHKEPNRAGYDECNRALFRRGRRIQLPIRLIDKHSAEVADYIYDAEHEAVERDERLVRALIVVRVPYAAVAIEYGF